jgi:hypothetical protein
MAYNVTSEWEDIHVKLGNYLPTKEKDKTVEEIEKIAMETVEKFDPLETKTLEELKDLREEKDIFDDEEDEVLKAYEAKRMEELKILSKRPKFGSLIEFRKQDFVQEVTNAQKEVYVVVLLYQTYNEYSNILEKIIDNLSKKHQLVKFMKIQANNCIENYKDSDVPGIIIYYNGKLFKQFIPANYYFGGKEMNWKSI